MTNKEQAFNKYISQELIKWIIRSGMTKTELANQTGISTKTITRYINGATSFDFYKIVCLANALGVKNFHITHTEE